jgi:hypothetical protein
MMATPFCARRDFGGSSDKRRLFRVQRSLESASPKGPSKGCNCFEISNFVGEFYVRPTQNEHPASGLLIVGQSIAHRATRPPRRWNAASARMTESRFQTLEAPGFCF